MKTRAKRAADKRRIRELTVQKAKARGHTYAIWDTLQRGLCLRVRPSGAKVWYVVYAYRGRSRWYRIGPPDVVGLADARLMAQEIMLKVAKGGDPQAERKAERASKPISRHH